MRSQDVHGSGKDRRSHGSGKDKGGGALTSMYGSSQGQTSSMSSQNSPWRHSDQITEQFRTKGWDGVCLWHR